MSYQYLPGISILDLSANHRNGRAGRRLGSSLTRTNISRLLACDDANDLGHQICTQEQDEMFYKKEAERFLCHPCSEIYPICRPQQAQQLKQEIHVQVGEGLTECQGIQRLEFR